MVNYCCFFYISIIINIVVYSLQSHISQFLFLNPILISLPLAHYPLTHIPKSIPIPNIKPHHHDHHGLHLSAYTTAANATHHRQRSFCRAITIPTSSLRVATVQQPPPEPTCAPSSSASHSLSIILSSLSLEDQPVVPAAVQEVQTIMQS